MIENHRHDAIVRCSLFGVEHDENIDPWVQTMICFGISLLLIEDHRHDAIVRCNLFAVIHDESRRTFKNDEKHDERNDPFVSTGAPFMSLHLDGNEQMVSIPLVLIDLSVNIF